MELSLDVSATRNGNLFLEQLNEAANQSIRSKSGNEFLSAISNSETLLFLKRNFGNSQGNCIFGSWNSLPVKKFIESLLGEFKSLIDNAFPIYSELVERLKTLITQPESPNLLCLHRLESQTKKSGLLGLLHTVLSSLASQPEFSQFRESVEKFDFMRKTREVEDQGQVLAEQRRNYERELKALKEEKLKFQIEKEEFYKQKREFLNEDIENLDTEEANTKQLNQRHSRVPSISSKPTPFRKHTLSLANSNHHSQSPINSFRNLEKSNSPFLRTLSNCPFQSLPTISKENSLKDTISLISKIISGFREYFNKTQLESSIESNEFITIFSTNLPIIIKLMKALFVEATSEPNILLCKEGAIFIDFLQTAIFEDSGENGNSIDSDVNFFKSLISLLSHSSNSSSTNLLSIKLSINLSLTLLLVSTHIDSIVEGVVGLGRVFDGMEENKKGHILHYLLEKNGPRIMLTSLKSLISVGRATSSPILILFEILFEYLTSESLAPEFFHQIGNQQTLEILMEASNCTDFSPENHFENLVNLFGGVLDCAGIRVNTREKVTEFLRGKFLEYSNES